MGPIDLIGIRPLPVQWNRAARKLDYAPLPLLSKSPKLGRPSSGSRWTFLEQHSFARDLFHNHAWLS